MQKYHAEGLETKAFLVTGGAGFIGYIIEYLCCITGWKG